MTKPRKKSRRAIVHTILAAAPNGGLSKQDLARAVRDQMGERWYRENAWQDFMRGVAADARARDKSGLPLAAEINGQYLRRSAWGPKDYEYAMRKLVTNAQRMTQMAQRLSVECWDLHKVDLNLEAMLDEMIDFAEIAAEHCEEIIAARDAKAAKATPVKKRAAAR